MPSGKNQILISRLFLYLKIFDICIPLKKYVIFSEIQNGARDISTGIFGLT